MTILYRPKGFPVIVCGCEWPLLVQHRGTALYEARFVWHIKGERWSSACDRVTGNCKSCGNPFDIRIREDVARILHHWANKTEDWRRSNALQSLACIAYAWKCCSLDQVEELYLWGGFPLIDTSSTEAVVLLKGKSIKWAPVEEPKPPTAVVLMCQGSGERQPVKLMLNSEARIRFYQAWRHVELYGVTPDEFNVLRHWDRARDDDAFEFFADTLEEYADRQ